MNQVDNPTQRNQKPMFNTIEPSIVMTQFASINTDASFSSYLQPNHHRQQRAEESDQIGIFDAANYFKDSLYEQKEQTASPRVAKLSSSSSCTDPDNNYRARSFHGATTVSSEASWTSQTGLLQQPNPSSLMVKQNQTPSTNTTTRWSPKWLINYVFPSKESMVSQTWIQLVGHILKFLKSFIFLLRCVCEGVLESYRGVGMSIIIIVATIIILISVLAHLPKSSVFVTNDVDFNIELSLRLIHVQN